MTRISDKHYKCPNCKHAILLTGAEFIQGIAVASCNGCGRDAFAIEEMFLDG
jgi:transcription elongation factor Elf1